MDQLISLANHFFSQSWTQYSQRASSSDLVASLRTLVDPVLIFLSKATLSEDPLPDDTPYNAAADFLVDVLTNYSSFFTEPHYNLIALLLESEWGQERYEALVGGNYDTDFQQFGLMLIAYGDARVVTLMQSGEERHRIMLAKLCGLLNGSGYPVAEDVMFVPALDFWSTFVETMTDSLYSDEGTPPEWMQPALSVVLQAIGHCWKKIQYPPIEVFTSWDSDERVGFGDARKDVADLLQTVYSLSGRSLISQFVSLLLLAIPTKSWVEIEAAAFCLAALSDCIPDDNQCDDLLDKLFSPAFFNLLNLGEAHLPVRLRQTTLSLIERYSEYFERHSQFLPAALKLLFDAVGSGTLAAASSKSIATLCSSCRTLLSGEVGAFLGHFQTLHANPRLDSLAEERIFMAISSIIQAIQNEDRRLPFLEQLFLFVRDDVRHCLEMKADGGPLNFGDPLVAKGARQCQVKEGQLPVPDEVLSQIAIHSLRCLVSMAKGMQGVAEYIDLESDAAKALPLAPGGQNFSAIQNEIVGIMAQLQSAFPYSTEVVETMCNILKAGFSETEAGPFVFPANVVTAFFTQQGLQTPQIGMVVRTACSFVSSLTKGPSSTVPGSLANLMQWVVSLLIGLPGKNALYFPSSRQLLLTEFSVSRAGVRHRSCPRRDRIHVPGHDQEARGAPAAATHLFARILLPVHPPGPGRKGATAKAGRGRVLGKFSCDHAVWPLHS